MRARVAYPQAELHRKFFFLHCGCKSSTITTTLFSELARFPYLYNQYNASNVVAHCSRKRNPVLPAKPQSVIQSNICSLSKMHWYSRCLIRFDYSSCNLRLPRIGVAKRDFGASYIKDKVRNVGQQCCRRNHLSDRMEIPMQISYVRFICKFTNNYRRYLIFIYMNIIFQLYIPL